MAKWVRITPGLHVAVGLRFLIDSAPSELPGLEKFDAPEGAKFQMFYFDQLAMGTPLHLPPEAMTALRAEVRFRKRVGHHIIFARHGEPKPFTFTEGEYVTLMLDPDDTNPFVPVYIRDNKELRFFVLKARWLGDKITISVEELVTPEVIANEVPEFLIHLPKKIEVAENSYLLLE